MPNINQSILDSVNRAIEKQINETWAAGLPITIGRDGKIIKIYPDGTEEVVKDTEKLPVHVEKLEYKL